VRIPARPEGLKFAVYKLSKRFDQDISAVCAAFSLQLWEGKVANPRLCFGGMAGIPKRASAAERVLAGADWNEAAVVAAQQAMLEDFTPLSDWRASSGYRMQAAQNLLRRFFLETQGDAPAQLQRGLA
jgi:xanthine dehydrogenase small subunit